MKRNHDEASVELQANPIRRLGLGWVVRRVFSYTTTAWLMTFVLVFLLALAGGAPEAQQVLHQHLGRFVGLVAFHVALIVFRLFLDARPVAGFGSAEVCSSNAPRCSAYRGPLRSAEPTTRVERGRVSKWLSAHPFWLGASIWCVWSVGGGALVTWSRGAADPVSDGAWFALAVALFAPFFGFLFYRRSEAYARKHATDVAWAVADAEHRLEERERATSCDPARTPGNR